jgi:hypothetical protein
MKRTISLIAPFALIIAGFSSVTLADDSKGQDISPKPVTPGQDVSQPGASKLNLYVYEKGGTRITLPEGVCDGVQMPIKYQQVRNGHLYKGQLLATTEIACTEEGAVLQGSFTETRRATADVSEQMCSGILRLELSEEGLDARWRLSEENMATCETAGREYVTYDMLSKQDTRGSLVSLANYAGESLRPFSQYEVLAPVACFQQANNNSAKIGVLEMGMKFDAAQGENGTFVHYDSNQSPWLQTQILGQACFVRAGFKYVQSLN